MSPFVKKFIRQGVFFNILTGLAAAYIRFVYKTTSWVVFHGETPADMVNKNEGFIVSFWHQRLFMAVCGWVYPAPFSMIISSHKDGQLIAKTVQRFGILWIAGSSSKGGAQALKNAIRRLKAGEVVGITPDGPRGPKLKAQSGVIAMAQMSDVPIVPFTYAMTHEITLKTWDEFKFPLPFGKGVIIWGKPIKTKKMEMLEGQKLLEDEMAALQKEAALKLRSLEV
jgi:lysophospholipid acyltransferase (LPLAT)-like uncharacterized protein